MRIPVLAAVTWLTAALVAHAEPSEQLDWAKLASGDVADETVGLIWFRPHRQMFVGQSAETQFSLYGLHPVAPALEESLDVTLSDCVDAVLLGTRQAMPANYFDADRSYAALVRYRRHPEPGLIVREVRAEVDEQGPQVGDVLLQLDDFGGLSGCASVETPLERLRRYADRVRPGEVIRGVVRRGQETRPVTWAAPDPANGIGLVVQYNPRHVFETSWVGYYGYGDTFFERSSRIPRTQCARDERGEVLGIEGKVEGQSNEQILEVVIENKSDALIIPLDLQFIVHAGDTETQGSLRLFDKDRILDAAFLAQGHVLRIQSPPLPTSWPGARFDLVLATYWRPSGEVAKALAPYLRVKPNIRIRILPESRSRPLSVNVTSKEPVPLGLFVEFKREGDRAFTGSSVVRLGAEGSTDMAQGRLRRSLRNIRRARTTRWFLPIGSSPGRHATPTVLLKISGLKDVQVPVEVNDRR